MLRLRSENWTSVRPWLQGHNWRDNPAVAVAAAGSIGRSGLLRWPHLLSSAPREGEEQEQQPSPFFGRRGGLGAKDGLRRRAWLVCARLAAAAAAATNDKDNDERTPFHAAFAAVAATSWPVPPWASTLGAAAEALVGLFQGMAGVNNSCHVIRLVLDPRFLS